MNRRDIMTAGLGLFVFAYAGAAQPSLPSTFQSRTVASPAGAQIFVRSAGSRTDVLEVVLRFGRRWLRQQDSFNLFTFPPLSAPYPP